MAFFNSTIAAYAQGRSVVRAILAEHDFASGMRRNWTGYGTLTLDGNDWIGAGDLVAFSPLPFGADDAASPITITLSGVEPVYIAEAKLEPPVRGRAQRLYLQFFDLAALAPLDTKILIADRVMDTMTWGGTGPGERRVAVTSEDVWADRDIAEYANFSDADQQVLYPGDRGLEFVQEYVPGYRLTWPDYSVT